MSDLSSLLAGLEKSSPGTLAGKKVRLQSPTTHTVVVGHILKYDPNSEFIDVELDEEPAGTQPAIQSGQPAVIPTSVGELLGAAETQSAQLSSQQGVHSAASGAGTSEAWQPSPSADDLFDMFMNEPRGGTASSSTAALLSDPGNSAAGPISSKPLNADLLFDFDTTPKPTGADMNGTPGSDANGSLSEAGSRVAAAQVGPQPLNDDFLFDFDLSAGPVETTITGSAPAAIANFDPFDALASGADKVQPLTTTTVSSPPVWDGFPQPLPVISQQSGSKAPVPSAGFMSSSPFASATNAPAFPITTALQLAPHGGSVASVQAQPDAAVSGVFSGELSAWVHGGNEESPPSFSFPADQGTGSRDQVRANGSAEGAAKDGGADFAGFDPAPVEKVESPRWDAFEAVGAGTPEAAPPPRPAQTATPASLPPPPPPPHINDAAPPSSSGQGPPARGLFKDGSSELLTGGRQQAATAAEAAEVFDPFAALASTSKAPAPPLDPEPTTRQQRSSDPGSPPRIAPPSPAKPTSPLLPPPPPPGSRLPSPASTPSLHPPPHTPAVLTASSSAPSLLAPPTQASASSSAATSRESSTSRPAPPSLTVPRTDSPFAAASRAQPATSSAAAAAAAAAGQTQQGEAVPQQQPTAAAADPMEGRASRSLSDVAGLTLIAEPEATYGHHEDGFLIVNGVASATFEVEGRRRGREWVRWPFRKPEWRGEAAFPATKRKAWLSEMTQVILSAIIGNTLEWYDFLIYVYLNPIITKLFFPKDNPAAQNLAYWGIFAVGFLSRPLGALVFGHIGDKFSRKTALILSIWLMSLPTALIGCLPTYHMVGMAAPVLLCLTRILQGLALGGEFTGTIVFLVEHAKPHRRGVTGSWAFFSVATGILLGSAVSLSFLLSFTQEQLLAWAWRLPFLAALAGSVLGGYLRATIRDPTEFERSLRGYGPQRGEDADVGALKVVRVDEEQGVQASAGSNGQYTRAPRASQPGAEDPGTEDVSLVTADVLADTHAGGKAEPTPSAPDETHAADHLPLKRIFTHHFYRLLLVLLIDFMTSYGFYIIVIYLPVYLTNVRHFPHRDVQIITTVNTIVLAVSIPVGGMLGDRFGRQKLVLLPTAFMAVLGYPLFLLMGVHELGAAWFAQFLLVSCVGLYSGSLPATLVEIFPVEARYTGISFAHNLSMAVFGGTAPLVATAMVQETGDKASPAGLIIVAAFLSSLAVLGLRGLHIK